MSTNQRLTQTQEFLDGDSISQMHRDKSHTHATPDSSEKTINTQAGQFLVTDAGVYLHSEENGKEWISSRVDVLAHTRTNGNENWGRMLFWKDSDGCEHCLAVPASAICGDGLELLRRLVSGGVMVSPKRSYREKFLAYLQFSSADARARCVDRLGWFNDVFVTPSGIVGESQERTVFQDESQPDFAMERSGELDDWKQTVARHAMGNSRLTFAISAALASPLLGLTSDESGGFHFVGDSSSGKSRCLHAAASVWGHPRRFCSTWRATTNGLESLAVSRNDMLLVMDELGQGDAAYAAEAAYMLANGQGKVRGSTSKYGRQVSNWRLLFISAGEVSLADHMNSDGRAIRVGQEIRLANISADAGAGFRIFDTIHDFLSGAAFADAIMADCEKNHGEVGWQWLHLLVKNRANITNELSDTIAKSASMFAGNNANGQIARVARRFALVATAGELATRYGLTGWQAGFATEAAKRCFASWLDHFGNVENKEDDRILAQVAAFFEKYGASRFQELDAQMLGTFNPNNRAGYVRYVQFNEGTLRSKQYLVNTSAFEEDICKGYPKKRVVQLLIDRGWLVKTKDNKPTHKNMRIAGEIVPPRLYIFAPGCVGGEEEVLALK